MDISTSLDVLSSLMFPPKHRMMRIPGSSCSSPYPRIPGWGLPNPHRQGSIPIYSHLFRRFLLVSCHMLLPKPLCSKILSFLQIRSLVLIKSPWFCWSSPNLGLYENGADPNKWSLSRECVPWFLEKKSGENPYKSSWLMINFILKSSFNGISQFFYISYISNIFQISLYILINVI
jgi:hypothetical protein